MNIIEQIKEVIDTVRIYIQSDGGDLEFVEYDESKHQVSIRLLGACIGCSAIDTTYKDGLESILKDEIDNNISLIIVD